MGHKAAIAVVLRDLLLGDLVRSVIKRSHKAAPQREGPCLMLEHVRADVHEHLLAGGGPGHAGYQVAHHFSGEKEAGLLSEHGGDSILEPLHGWIVEEHVVADFSVGHIIQHLESWFGH